MVIELLLVFLLCTSFLNFLDVDIWIWYLYFLLFFLIWTLIFLEAVFETFVILALYFSNAFTSSLFSEFWLFCSAFFSLFWVLSCVLFCVLFWVLFCAFSSLGIKVSFVELHTLHLYVLIPVVVAVAATVTVPSSHACIPVEGIFSPSCNKILHSEQYESPVFPSETHVASLTFLSTGVWSIVFALTPLLIKTSHTEQ